MKKKFLFLIIIATILVGGMCLLTGCTNNSKEETLLKDNNVLNDEKEIKKSEGESTNITDNNTIKFTYITSNNANTVALDSEGNVWTMYNATDPTKVSINAKIVSVDAGQHFTVALDSEGNVWTWGKNNCGQLGDGTTTENQVPQKVLGNVSMISVGYDFVLAITKNNELYSWGYGKLHYLPKDDATDTSDYLVPTKYVSDIKFTYAEAGKAGGATAIDEDGNRYVWGALTCLLGVEPSQLGFEAEATPYVVKKVSDDTIKFKKIFLYSNAAFAIDETGNLYGAGNKNAVIGISHEDSTVAKFTQIAKGTKFKDVCSRDKYSIALDENGNIWAWGENNEITTKESVEPFKLTEKTKYVGIAFNNFIDKLAYAIDENGNLYVWGEGKSTTPTLVNVEK